MWRAGLGIEAMAVYAFHHKTGAVEIKTVARHKFERAEAYFLIYRVNLPPLAVFKGEAQIIEIGVLGIPSLDIAEGETDIMLRACRQTDHLRLSAVDFSRQ